MKNIMKRLMYFVDRKFSMKMIDAKLKKNLDFISRPLEIVTVPLDLIQYECTFKKLTEIRRHRSIFFNQIIYKNGVILDGDWDFSKKEYKESIYLKEFRERFVENKRWEETNLYQRYQNRSDTKKQRETENWEEYKTKYLSEWDKLYHDIKENGYKSNYELTGKPLEVIVCVTRSGEIMRTPFGGGTHRFAIAKILGIKEIPVVVSVWHKEYIDQLKAHTTIKKITPKTAIQPILQRGQNSLKTRPNNLFNNTHKF